MKPYVPLWCRSNYSFLEGASEPAEYITACRQLGLPAIAITDRDGLYGVVRAHLQAAEHGVRLIIGAEMTIDDGSSITLLCKDRRGYENLCKLISTGRLRSPKGQSSVSWDEVAESAPGLFALWGAEGAPIYRKQAPLQLISLLRDAFDDRLFALLSRHRQANDIQREALLIERAEHFGIPLVAATEVLYHTPARRDLQDVLTCIREGSSLHSIGTATCQNAEHALKSPQAFRKLFADQTRAVEATLAIAESCTFSLAELDYRYPADYAPEGYTPNAWLRHLAWKGAAWRYPAGIPDDVRAQLQREIELVEELDYGGYFLTMKEIVDYCHDHAILCQGRGSAANSALCYCLGITAIDPVRMGLLFERFLSRERAEPPDIDLDIAHQRREEVIQHVYERYGRERAAMVANVVRYRPRSAIRDVGKALGLPETNLDRAARLISPRGNVSAEALEKAGLAMDHPLHQHLWRLSNELLDFPRHLSIHPGGFLLGNRPIHTLVPVENATMEKRTVIQWDKYDVEDLGLFKVDLLGLGALSQIDDCLQLISKHHGERWTMATIPAHDDATFAMISEADTVGVFQIESRAQMSMLPRLKPREFYDLVIEVSIVRPGPITGGMVHPYLRRRCGEEPVTYPHPSLEPVLKRTLGVPLFQEQVMRLAVVAADYTPGEADQLRRDMAAWKKSGRIEAHRERLVSRMMSRGIEREFAERVFEQIRGFGEYGFPESHAASFALIAWVTAWLKCHYHEAFTCSLLNAQPMGFYAPATLIEDARRHEVVVRPVDVTCSELACTLEPLREGDATRWRFAIRSGLSQVRSLSRDAAVKLLAAREERAFDSLRDLVERSGLNAGELKALAESGALDALTSSRRGALWELRKLKAAPALPLALEERDDVPDEAFPQLDLFETLEWDYRTTGASTRGHILEPLRDQLRALRLPDAQTLRGYPNGRNVRYAGVVICRQRPGTASGVVFLTLEDESGFVNAIIWPKVWEDFSIVIKSSSFLGIRGRLQIQDGICHVIVRDVWVPRLQRPLPAMRSHDFH